MQNLSGKTKRGALGIAGIALLAVTGFGVSSVTTATAQAPAAPGAPAADAPDGAAVYTANCAGCHGANGEGGVGPALAGNAALADNALVINQILHGGEIMPPFMDTLTDDEIAAVANHIRSSWGNTNATPITVEEVATARAAPPAGDAPAAPPAP
ncbi:MAG: cytochrome c [Bauldia sp.]